MPILTFDPLPPNPLTPLPLPLIELAYENALELNPHHMPSLANLYTLKRAAGDYDGAKVCT